MTKLDRPHRVAYRVYYEDTDAGGVVYYANYLKFAERARTEALRDAGLEQTKLREKEGIIFVVRKCDAEFHRPARLDDELVIETTLREIAASRMSMQQAVRRREEFLATLTVELVCINEDFKPLRIPEKVRKGLEKYLMKN